MEDRIKKLELIVKRLSRRSRKKVTALITPYPISSAVFGEDVKGPVLHYMFPCEGIITKGMIDIGERLKAGANVTISLKNRVHGEAKSYILPRRNILVKPDIEVDSGDQLTISIHPNDVEELITEVWVSFLWIPSVKEVEVKSYLIDELDHDLLEEGE